MCEEKYCSAHENMELEKAFRCIHVDEEKICVPHDNMELEKSLGLHIS